MTVADRTAQIAISPAFATAIAADGRFALPVVSYEEPSLC
jgi:hypothetical protein